jgi:hypothetical protein
MRKFWLRLVVPLLIFMAALPSGSAAQGGETSPKIYVGPDDITEKFGRREAPYAGFLVLPQSALPDGYSETTQHYTKTEYIIKFRKMIENTSYDIEVTESDVIKYFEPPKYNVAKEFVFNGRGGRVLSYRERLTDRQALVLYWINPPKQRLSIFVELEPSHPISPDDLINLLAAMTPATVVPALITPF